MSSIRRNRSKQRAAESLARMDKIRYKIVMMRILIFAFIVAISLLSLQVRAEEATGDASAAAAFDLLLAGEYEKARAMAAPLAEAGDADAQHLMGYLDEKGLGGPKDLASAIAFYMKSAEQGQPDAQFALGELAYFGDGVVQDDETAAGWFALAERQGHARAKMRLGYMYAKGLGVEPDQRRSLQLFEEAAKLGDAEAQYNLGVAYLTGDGTDQDYKKAAAWFEQAGVQGHADSQYNLALIYDAGLAGKKDPEKTLKWMTAAADSGLTAAYVALGLMTHGGVTGDEAPSAADWFQRAADAGDPQGQFLYAVALKEGDGREKDLAGAIMWIDRSLAAEEGGLEPQTRQEAEALRSQIIAEMSSAGQ